MFFVEIVAYEFTIRSSCIFVSLFYCFSCVIFDGKVPIYFLKVFVKNELFSNPQRVAASDTLLPSAIYSAAFMHRYSLRFSNIVCPVIFLKILQRVYLSVKTSFEIKSSEIFLS